MSLKPIEVLVRSHVDSDVQYMACYPPDSQLIAHVPQLWLDLLPYMVARVLLDRDYNADRVLVVRLQGADFELMHAPLGAVAAPPIVNYAKPVRRAAYNYRPERKRAA